MCCQITFPFKNSFLGGLPAAAEDDLYTNQCYIPRDYSKMYPEKKFAAVLGKNFEEI
jgi:hypothetical protein